MMICLGFLKGVLESLDNVSLFDASCPTYIHKNLGFGDLYLELDSKLVKDAILLRMEIV
jgi:hypothetical protein